MTHSQRQTQLFTKTRREAPKDEEAKNAELLIRAGFINKEMAGVYDYLPLGLRVLNKIQNIIRVEMDAIGGQEIFMSSLQRKELWEKTDRWSDENIDNWFKTSLKNGSELGLGFTHEEPMTNMMEQYVPSYQNLPTYVYQFQTKFRNEERSKSGILRTREFVMKDLYSFHKDEESLGEFYDKVSEAYTRIFDNVGLGKVTYKTFASGGAFSKYSHEFQAVSDAGEDTIYIDVDKNIAINKEVYNDEVLNELGLDKSKLEEKKSIEVGNIFKLGTRFSDALLCKFTDESGEKKSVVMGSYGIGPGRLMGTVVEVLADDKGLVWPASIAPFSVHLIEISSNKSEMQEKVREKAEEIYNKLSEKTDVLWDDRDARAGEKFADADLIGIPTQIIISERNLEKGIVEVKNRATGEVKEINIEQVDSII